MTNHDIADNEETATRAAAVITILAGAFDALATPGSVQIDHGKSRLFSAVFGWWAGITRSSQAVVVLHEAGLAHESKPIVRTILQHTLVMQWLVDTGDDAVDAVAEYRDDNVRLLLGTVADAKWPLPDGFTMQAPPKPIKPNPCVTKLKNFEELCIAYGAYQLYVPYRVLSAYAHPTAAGAMAYTDEHGTLASRAVSNTHGPLIQTAMCLIQAGHTISPLIQGDPLRNSITHAEERLGAQIGLWSLKSETSDHRTEPADPTS